MYRVKLKDKGNNFYGIVKGDIFEFSLFEEKDKFLLANKLEDEVDWIDWGDGKGPQKLVLDMCGTMAWYPKKELGGG